MKRKNFSTYNRRRQLAIDWLYNAAAEASGCTYDELISDSRAYAPVHARLLVMHYLQGKGMKQIAIAEMFGKDHTTISVMLCSYFDRVRFDRRFAEIEKKFNQLIKEHEYERLSLRHARNL